MKRFLMCIFLSSFMLQVMPQEDYVNPVVAKGTEQHEIPADLMLIYLDMAYNYACVSDVEKSIEYADKAVWADDELQDMFHLWMFIIASEGIIDEEAKPTTEELEPND